MNLLKKGTSITLDTNIIGAALKNGSEFLKLTAQKEFKLYTCETTLTLDGLDLKQKLKCACKKTVDPKYSVKTWRGRLEADLKFLLCPRIGMSRPDIVKKNTADDIMYEAPERHKRTCKAIRFIEDEMGAGRSRLLEIAKLYDSNASVTPGDKHYSNIIINNIDDIKPGDLKGIFSDWADADFIGSHYGYGIDVFCTNDLGKGAGGRSVLSMKNRERLEYKFGIKFITLESLMS